MPNFSDIVEEVISLETEQMEEIKDIISKALVEKKRASFLINHQDSLQDAIEGALFSSNNPTEIAQWLKNL
jgi:hypothetical protein